MKAKVIKLLYLLSCSPLFKTIFKYLIDNLVIKIWNFIIRKKDIKNVINDIPYQCGQDYTVGLNEDDTHTTQEPITKELDIKDITPKKPRVRKTKPKVINTLDTPGTIATPLTKKKTTYKRTTKKDK